MDYIVAELAGDLVLQPLDTVGLELDDGTGLDVDQMVMMLAATSATSAVGITSTATSRQCGSESTKSLRHIFSC